MGEFNTYYTDKDLDSVKLIHNCFTELLRNKYKDITFYIHNMGKFDFFFIKYLPDFNKTKQGVKNPYYFETTTRNSDILKLTIKRKIDEKFKTFKLLDTYAVLPKNLRSLCINYKI